MPTAATAILLCGRLHRRGLHTAVKYPLTHPIYTIWASNTSLGKTLVSTGLSISFLSNPNNFKLTYLKPIQTGFPLDSDSRFLYSRFSRFFARNPPPFSVFASNATLRASVPAIGAVSGGFSGDVEELRGKPGNLQLYEERRLLGSDGDISSVPASEVIAKTVFAWREAVSPHLAAERENAMVGDGELLNVLERCLRDGLQKEEDEEKEVMFLIETAGGVASPGPSGTLQCDLYRGFRLPAILVGDGRLGGISGTISAYESLKLRGYDVAAVIFEDHGLVNEVPLLSYLRNRK